MNGDKNITEAERLFRCAGEFVIAWHNMPMAGNLSKKQFHALSMISYMGCENENGITISELAAKIGVSLPAMSQNITSLADAGYIERLPDADDRRITYLKLTKKGEAELHQTLQYTLNILNAATKGLNRAQICEDLTQLTAALKAAAANINKGEFDLHA